jgi:hypothetical protein
MPSEYYLEVLGGEMSDACEFGSFDEANEILGLMLWQWNTMASTLYKGEKSTCRFGGTRTAWRMAKRLGSRLHAGHAHAP